MSNYGNLKILACRAASDFSQKIAALLDTNIVRTDVEEFKNDNTRICIREDVRGADVFVIQQSPPPVNHNLMELIFTIRLLNQESAGRITAVIPYYFYARSLITAAFVAEQLSFAGADRVVTMDPHSKAIRGYVVQSRMKYDYLTAAQILRQHAIKEAKNSLVLVAPDAGSAKHVGKHAEALDLPLAIIDKRRKDHSGKSYATTIVGDIKNNDILMLDDEILTGGTLMNAAELLKKEGAKNIFAACTHAFINKEIVQNIENSALDKLFITDTVPIAPEIITPKISVLSVAENFADAIKRIHEDRSIKGMRNNK